MAVVKKSVSCKCGKSFYFEFASDMEVEDLTVSSRCSSCGNGLYISVSSMGAPKPSIAQEISIASQVSPSLDSLVSAPASASEPASDWNIGELEHIAPSQSGLAQAAAQSESSSGQAPAQQPDTASSALPEKKVSVGSKSAALNDVMHELFREE